MITNIANLSCITPTASTAFEDPSELTAKPLNIAPLGDHSEHLTGAAGFRSHNEMTDQIPLETVKRYRLSWSGTKWMSDIFVLAIEMDLRREPKMSGIVDHLVPMRQACRTQFSSSLVD